MRIKRIDLTYDVIEDLLKDKLELPKDLEIVKICDRKDQTYDISYRVLTLIVRSRDFGDMPIEYEIERINPIERQKNEQA